MTQQLDSNGELRAAYTMRELEKAKSSFPTGTTGVFIRVTLAVIFMYLTVISYLMLGIAGPVFVSILFLAAFLITWRMAAGLGEKIRYGETTFILAMPVWYGYALGMIGAVLFIVVCLYTVWRSVNELIAGREATH